MDPKYKKVAISCQLPVMIKKFQVYKKWKRKSRAALAVVKFSKRNKCAVFSKAGNVEQNVGGISDLDNREFLLVS